MLLLLFSSRVKFKNWIFYNSTQLQKDFLTLGPNSRLFQGYTNINKNSEIEILYLNILKLRDNKVISIKPEFRDLLKAETIKIDTTKKQPTITNSSTKKSR